MSAREVERRLRVAEQLEGMRPGLAPWLAASSGRLVDHLLSRVPPGQRRTFAAKRAAETRAAREADG
jgi:hypothetical protein